ncbi:cAMP-binding proteins-catabolite gene activator and regulatory subunit of cAMP-dependent protein kinases [Magnetospirillum sp. LM-5]|uniref:Crp/Fnr family transcriptional regulator n=1 Tax=Magnetospirillum sp. LM-5 TaxID=2681466 RepID=UPI00137F793F|nr:helix-turn-helix domain-containing protein [Magnetospirillum sp. LM-5]CAA7615018.1 cAMP-binding proteins-catabolite gene activator and regulatory subunit of cAMP-dependent protein kinases [Magnetospirillum sp. LM-5]
MAGLSAADLALCAKAPLFAALGAGELEMLVGSASVVTYPETELLFSQGDPADRFFVVLAGRVNIFALTETGDQSIIEVFDGIATFAEAAMFSSGKFPLNCEVVAGSRLAHVPAAPFLKRLAENPKLGLHLLSGLSRWQLRMIQEITELKSKSPGQRLASFLLALAKDQEGSAQVRLPITKAVLASRIGIAPESLSRALARLKSVGVESHGREVVLTDLDALRRLVREGANDLP